MLESLNPTTDDIIPRKNLCRLWPRHWDIFWKFVTPFWCNAASTTKIWFLYD